MKRKFVWMCAVAALAQCAQAQNFFRNNPDGIWDEITPNWGTASGGPYDQTWANGVNSTATFLGDAFGPMILGTDITLNHLTNNLSSGSLVINPGTGTKITLAGSNPVFDIVGQSIFNVPLAGAGVIKTGSGEMVMGIGGSTINGLTLNQGILSINAKDSVGVGPLTLNGGTLRTASSSTRSLSNSVVLGGNVTFGANGALVFTGTSMLTGNRTLTVDNDTMFFGAITEDSSGRSLIKEGQGSLLLANANTFTGDLHVNNGTLLIAQKNAIGRGALHMQNGTTLASLNATPRTFTNAINVHGNVTVGQTNNGTGALTMTGKVNLQGGSHTITTHGQTHVFSNSIYNGILTKGGNGNIVLAASNNLTGLFINGGTVTAIGRNSAGTNVVVNNGATLRGNPRVGDHITLNDGATLDPGDGVGSIATKHLIVDSSGEAATLNIDMSAANGLSGINWDFINGSGTLSLNGALVLKLVGNPADFNNAQNYIWNIAQFTDYTGLGVAGMTVDSSGFLPDLNNGTFAVELVGNQYLNLTFTAVPEPSTIALGAIGGLALLALRRRK